jgi:uncharacterized lipoprotein YddW (UPF0748 family)
MRFVKAAVGLLVLAGCAQPHPHPPPAPPPPAPLAQRPGEIRAVWVSDTIRLDWDEATRQLQRAGFNTMYVNLASGGAQFGSETVTRGIALAHQRGLAVHAKEIVMFMFKAPPDFQRQLIRQDRVMRGPDGKPIIQNGYAWLCPSDPRNQEQMLAVTRDLVTRYPVDGLQFDYIRFCEEPSCYCSRCRREAAKFGGDFNSWRLQLITDWVRQLSSIARQERPGLKISAAVFPILERAKEEKAQDWRLWLQRGYLDYVCTMNYTPDNREFEQRCRAAGRDRIVVGIGSWKMRELSAVQAQIDIVRRLGSPGFSLFSYDDSAARDFLPNVASRH